MRGVLADEDLALLFDLVGRPNDDRPGPGRIWTRAKWSGADAAAQRLGTPQMWADVEAQAIERAWADLASGDYARRNRLSVKERPVVCAYRNCSNPVPANRFGPPARYCRNACCKAEAYHANAEARERRKMARRERNGWREMPQRSPIQSPLVASLVGSPKTPSEAVPLRAPRRSA